MMLHPSGHCEERGDAATSLGLMHWPCVTRPKLLCRYAPRNDTLAVPGMT